jgi:hypothetical protein
MSKRLCSGPGELHIAVHVTTLQATELVYVFKTLYDGNSKSC